MNYKQYLVVIPGIVLAFVLYTLSQGFNARFDRLEKLMLQGFGMMGGVIALAMAVLEFAR